MDGVRVFNGDVLVVSVESVFISEGFCSILDDYKEVLSALGA